LTVAAAHAGDYPTKPIKLVVPFSPGGVVDRVARVVAPAIEKQLGQPLVFEYRPGAGGAIGAALVAKADPDGYTLLVGDTGSVIVSPQLQRSPPYDPIRDFTPISQLSSVASVLVVHPSLSANSVTELVAIARTRPGELSFGSAGIGSTSHRAAEQLMRMANIELIHVPYKGGAPATTDLMAGQISFIVESIPTALPYIRSGHLRPLGVTTSTRLPVLPDVPTIAESLPGFNEINRLGILAPAGTPRDIVRRLNAAIAFALKSDDVRKLLLEQGIVPVGDTPEEFADHLREEVTRVSEQIRQLGLGTN